ncbi:MAG TPA: GNAT family protein [Ktedonobacterales bacterium]|jgi:RimJ/RimL family protein N-acetyltransferase|nr:GNAT family protein [Ktedonobacterales bacterium]
MTNIWSGRLVRLRAVEPDDWKTHFAWDQDSDLSRQLDHVWFPPSAARARRWAEETALRASDGDDFAFEIEALSDGALVGHIGVHHCDRRVGSFSYGVATLPQHRRLGYASEAILLVARYYFQELRYQKMNAQVYSFNIASLALHEKLGFVREGTLRRMVYTGGQHYDLVEFGMTAEEFAARSPDLPSAW